MALKMKFSGDKYALIPYRWGGYTFKSCDCYGIIILYFQEELAIGLLNYKYQNMIHDEVIDSNMFIENVYNEFTKVEYKDIQLHDILLFQCDGQSQPGHIGVMVDKYKFLHTTKKHGVSFTRLSLWKDKLYGIYRHKDLMRA